MEPIQLAVDENVPGRPFASTERYGEDLAVLRVMIRDLRQVIEDGIAGRRRIVPYEHVEWRVDGLRHRVIVCNAARLLEHPEPCVVGFHSERYPNVDIGPLERANREVVNEFPGHPGVLSYSSLELPRGLWANLVLHEEPETAEEWRRSRVHAEVVARLSPIHYKNVRIHNGRLTGPVVRSPDIRILRTKYFDYEGGAGTQWRAERVLEAG